MHLLRAVRTVGSAAVCSAALLSACTGRGAARYEGTVTDQSVPDSQRTLGLTVLSWTDTSFGAVMEIGPPIGIVGGAYGWFLDSALTIVSVSDAGDTILWRSSVAGPAIKGTYHITGGHADGQAGSWSVHLVRGKVIAAKMLAAPAPDSGWMEAVLALLVLGAVGALVLRWVSRSPPRPASMPADAPAPPRQLYGVGGWMLFFLIGQGLTVLLMLVQLPSLYSSEMQSSWALGSLLPGMRSLLTFETVMHIWQILLPSVGIALTVKHHPWTPRVWVVYLLGLVAYGVIDILGGAHYQHLTTQLLAHTGAEEIGSDVSAAAVVNARLVVWASIWSLYWIRSVRVKQTFGHTALEAGLPSVVS